MTNNDKRNYLGERISNAIYIAFVFLFVVVIVVVVVAVAAAAAVVNINYAYWLHCVYYNNIFQIQ